MVELPLGFSQKGTVGRVTCMGKAKRAQLAGLNDRRCGIQPGLRSWCGAIQQRRAGRAQDRAVHARGGPGGWRHARADAGRLLSPVGRRPLPLGGLERELASAAHGCREAIAGRRCIFWAHRGVAARTRHDALRPDRGHDSRTDRQQPPGRRSGPPRPHRSPGNRSAARPTNDVGNPHSGRSRRQRSSDRRSRCRRPVPPRRSGHRRSAAQPCRGASGSQGHRSVKARC